MNMKKITAQLSIAILLVAGAASCKKEAFNINQNPNQATDSTIVYNVILPSAQNNTARLVARNWGWLQNYMGYWARSGTYAPNTQEETYTLTTSFQAQIWSAVYDVNYDYEVMRISAEKAGADFYAGIARIMKAHNSAILVDLYNNAPYSEALKGASNSTPKYDKGLDIYKDLLAQIDTGIAQIKNADLNTSGPNKSIGTDDVMFGTTSAAYQNTPYEQKELWAKFGNTVKLRLLVHLMNGGVGSNPAGTVGTPNSYVDEALIDAELAKIDAEGSGYMDFDAEVQPGYQNDKRNPFYNLYVSDNNGSATANSVYYKANAWGIDYYDYNGDPRQARFYVAGSQGMRGVAYGALPITENAAATLAGIGPGVTRGATAACWIMSAAESYFLQAEAMHRGKMSGDAKATLANGIRASFVMVGSTAAAANSYIAGNATYADVDYDAASRFGGAPGGLFTIISQKWFALNAIAPFEVYTDFRRVDFSSTVNHFEYGSSVGYDPGPAISVAPGVPADQQLPVRLLYPQAEYLYNAGNVGAEGTINAFTSKIFWDRN